MTVAKTLAAIRSCAVAWKASGCISGFARRQQSARKDGPELNADTHTESLNPFAVFPIGIGTTARFPCHRC